MKYHSQNFYSIEVKEILGKTPSFLMRWGIGGTLATFLSVLIFSWFYRYPTIIEAPVTLYAQHPPVAVVAQTDAAIESILVKNKEFAYAGQPVVLLHSTANSQDVFSLLNYLSEQDTTGYRFSSTQMPPIGLNLGDLQDSYANFQYAYYRFFKLAPGDYFSGRKGLMQEKVV